MAPMWKLTIVDDEGKRTVLPLSRNEYNVGRDEENTIRLTDRNISRKHLVLRRSDANAWTVEDLNSYNGCYVNGLRVSGTHPLHHADLLQLGDYRLELVDEETAALENATDAAQTMPVPPTSRLLDRPDRLVVVDGPSAGSEFPLENERMLIGRAEDVDISINHSSVSRVHAEIIRLDNGRYEMVDRGSSNGIRINGIKLERRVIDDDDEIELGDVRLRFVVRGQIFRLGSAPRAPSAGTSGSAKSSTLRPSGQDRKSGIGIMVIAGAVFGLVFVAGFVALLPKPASQAPDQDPSAIHPTEDIATLWTEAQRLGSVGDVDGAHTKVNELPLGSPQRESTEAKALEGRWADSIFSRVARETDLAKKRMMLSAVAGAPLVDSERRRRAIDELRDLEIRGSDPQAPPSVSSSGAPGPADVPHLVASALPAETAPPLRNEPPRHKEPRSGPLETAYPNERPTKPKDPQTSQPASPGTAPPTPTASSTRGDPSKLVLEGNDGESRARKALEPKVWSGRGTVEDIQMLRAICRHQRDQACVTRANALLQEALPKNH